MKRSIVICLLLAFGLVNIQAQNKIVQTDLKKYEVSINDGKIRQIEVDTLILASQMYHPLYKKFPGWVELGNMGFPALPLKFNGIGETNTPFFLKPYLTYNSESDKISFYDTKSPFSQFSFIGEMNSDTKYVGQVMNFFYSRSFGRDINITGLFDFVSSTGHYSHQLATQSLINFNLSVEKVRYRHYSSFERNQFKLEENGGMVDDSTAINAFRSYTSTLGVNLNDATSKTSIMRLKGWHSYDLFSRVVNDSIDSLAVYNKYERFKPALVHRYSFTSAQRLYNDDYSTLDFYPDTLFSDSQTRDSIQHYDFVNDFNIRIEGAISDSSAWFIEAGLHHELLHLYSFFGSTWKQGIGIGSSAGIDLKRFKVYGQGRIILAGYEAGDYKLDARARYKGRLSELELRFISKAYTPDLFLSNYIGNHFQWSNDFSKQLEQGAGVFFNIPGWKSSIDANVNVISNWIYINHEAHPEQMENSAFLASTGIKKSFKAGPLRSVNSVYLNYTTAREIPLPLVLASTSNFMHHDIHFKKTNGLLQIEYGFDCRFFSGYKGYAYMPATGLFYLQDEKIIGNYPVLDLFFIARVKRTRFFVKWEHANYGFTGGNIFPVLHYPMKQRNIKYGVYWHFHD